jgi:protein tyrosine phosphatase (PTP) superfamily phosphohydrolase (DUF442 family)
MMTVESIYKYRKIDDRIATGGQPTEAQFEAIRDEGYQAVINLAPSDAENHALPNESEILSALGIDYIHIPVAWTNPTRANFQAFCAAMSQLKSKKTFIHCAANMRVMAFYALYAKTFENWTQEQADALISGVWESIPGYRMDETWKRFLAAED